MKNCKVYSAKVEDAFTVPLYHATPAKKSICNEGFKTGDELGNERRTLGSITKFEKYTSFTASKNIAIGIAKDIQTAIAIANGKVNVDTLPSFMDKVDDGYCSGSLKRPFRTPSSDRNMPQKPLALTASSLMSSVSLTLRRFRQKRSVSRVLYPGSSEMAQRYPAFLHSSISRCV